MKRLTMDEVINRFAKIESQLCTWKLRSRIARNNEIGLSPPGGRLAIGIRP